MILDSMFWGLILVGIFASIIGLAVNVYLYNAPKNGSLVTVTQAQTILGSSNCNRNVVLNAITSIPEWNVNGPEGDGTLQYEPPEQVIYDGNIWQCEAQNITIIPGSTESNKYEQWKLVGPVPEGSIVMPTCFDGATIQFTSSFQCVDFTLNFFQPDRINPVINQNNVNASMDTQTVLKCSSIGSQWFCNQYMDRTS